MNIRENKKERMKKKRDALMVAATLIAVMAFQSALNPPGGVWDDDKNSGGGKMSAGTSIMVHYYPEDYQLFMACNAVCFFASLRIVFLVVSGVPFVRKRILMWLLMIIMWITLTGMGLTYLVSMVIISPTKDDSEATSLRNKLPDISISLVCFGIGMCVVWCAFHCCIGSHYPFPHIVCAESAKSYPILLQGQLI